MAIQGALFQDDEQKPKKWRIPAISGERYPIEPFDFEAQDEWSHKPGFPDGIPEWLALGIDDPEWMPDAGGMVFG